MAKEKESLQISRKEKLQEGDQVQGSPFPVKVDAQGNRKVIPAEMVDFQWSGKLRHGIKSGDVTSMHTIAAEQLAARQKGTIVGKTEKKAK